MATGDIKTKGQIGKHGVENGYGSVLPAVVPLGCGDRKHSAFTNGGNPDLLVNGSVTPKEFELGPAAGVVWRNVRIRFVIAGGTGFSSETFGGAASAASNGLAIEVKGQALPVAIRNNTGFLAYAGPDGAAWIASGSSGAMVAEWPVASELRGDDDETVLITVSDNLSTLGLNFAMAVLAYDA